MADALWEWEALVAAAGGKSDGVPHAPITGVSIDTRTLAPGDVFVALKDQRDGHDFVDAAFANGAAAALVRDDYRRRPRDGALLRVEDTLLGLGRIGTAARARLGAEARVVAVTGSAGKTGTKEMLRAALGRLGRVHAPDKSFNNHFGVPLTLARMPRASDFAVFEIGMNHAGEIRPLSRMVRPHVAIVTNVLPVHIGNFPDGEIGVANAKAEIFDGGVAGGSAIIPRDSPHFALLAERASACGLRIISFGRHAESAVRLHSVQKTRKGNTELQVLTVETSRPSGRLLVELGMLGEHLARNALAVIAALEALGADTLTAAGALANVTSGAGRGARITLSAGGSGQILLIDESYNANPASMEAALHALGELEGRRIAVLGDMLELGSEAERYHTGLAAALGDARVDRVFACGPNMKLLYETLPPAMRGAWAPSSAGLVEAVAGSLKAGDVVMVKGSLGSRMAPIVEALKKRFAAA